jgi:hypothetical protein
MATLTRSLQHKRDTAANWTSNNTILLAGQFGFETDTTLYKIGDGSTAWNSLKYAGYIKGAGMAEGQNNAYTITLPGYPSLACGDFFLIKFAFHNTGPATITINSLSTIPLTKQGDNALEENDISDTQVLIGMYDGTNLQLIGVGGGGTSSVAFSAITGNATDNTSLANALTAAENNAKAYADGLVVGLWDDRGSFDASVNAYPSSGGSGSAGAIKKGDVWTVSVAGTLPTSQVVEVGDIVRALIDTPGNTQANWAIQQNNIGYTAENAANKDTDSTFAANSDTKYPSQKAVKTAVDAKVPTTRTLTVNGTAQDLSANRSFNIYPYQRFSGKQYTFPHSSIAATTGWNGVVICAPYYIGYDHTITDIGVEVTTGAAASNLRFALFTAVGGYPSALIVESGNIDSSTTGRKSFATTQNLLASSKIVFMAIQVSSSSVGLRYAPSVNAGIGLLATVATLSTNIYTMSQAFGAFPSTFTSTTETGNNYGALVSLTVQ